MKNLIVLLELFLLLGCDDFWEKDISGDSVLLVAPGRNIETYQEQQVFAWKEVDGASDYRLIVVTPDFEGVEEYLVDTVVQACTFRQILNPGKYEWQVEARNSAWKTSFSRSAFTILPAESEQKPVTYGQE